MDEKGKALVALDVGSYGVVSEATGIPIGTLSRWVFEASQRAATAGLTNATTPAEPSPAARPEPSAEAAVVAPVRVAQATTAPTLPVAPAMPRPTARARVAKVYTPSQIAQALERVAAIGVRPAAKELGISRNALRDWERKVEKAAKGEGVAPTSGPDPKTIEQRRDAAILGEWRKQQGLGPSQIRNQLRRAGTKVSVHTVRRVMEEAGYRPPKVERRDHTGDYEAVRPGQLWHMDFVHQYVHKQKVFVLALIDDYSRFVTGWALDDAERADAVIVAFDEAVKRYGRPEAVMSDGGSAFWAWKGSSRFTRVLEDYGVDQLIATTPELNGKSEVFNANLQKELFNRVVFSDVGDMRRRLGPHFSWYNHHRTHHALGGLLVPADRFYGRVEEVLARIEAGGGVPDAVDLALRTLDLFRVVSHRGKPEIWLMGRKIFDAKE
jgi:transposase InsO family protein